MHYLNGTGLILKEGFAEGEAKAKAEMVKKMLKAKLSIADMVLFSGLSEAQIIAIKSEPAE